MEPALVVVVFEERADPFPCIVDITVLIQVNLFAFQRAHEALRQGVVVRVPRAAHADGEARRLQFRDIGVGAVLNAAIGVVDDSLRHGAIGQGAA